MSGAVKRFRAADGLSLAFRDEGEGLPVLCLAGLTRTMDDFDRLAAILLPRHRVIRMDARGRGASDRAPDPAQYAVPQEAADALALLDHLGVEGAVFIGTSRGGLLTMTIAATAPERVLGAVLNDVGPVLSPEGLARIVEYVGRTPPARTIKEAAAALRAAMGAGFPGLSDAEWEEIARGNLEETPDGLRLRYDPRLREALLEQAKMLAEGAEKGMPPPDLWPLFEALRGRPVLALRGENSDILSPGTLAEMQRRMPEMKAVTVKNRGHVPFLDEPEAVAAIEALLAEVEARGRGG